MWDLLLVRKRHCYMGSPVLGFIYTFKNISKIEMKNQDQHARKSALSYLFDIINGIKLTSQRSSLTNKVTIGWCSSNRQLVFSQ